MVAPRQIHLPLTAMKPVCPLCGKPADTLGQYSPLYPHGVCRACSLAAPYPIEVFIQNASNDKTGLAINPNADRAAMNKRIELDLLITNAARKRPRRERAIMSLNISRRDLRAPVRYDRSGDYQNMLIQARQNNYARQMSWPLCDHCGQPHDRKTFFGDSQPLCRHCEDLEIVETFWEQRGIFRNEDGTLDHEAALDRLYNAPSFRGLFERGVLPDAWFELVQREKAV